VAGNAQLGYRRVSHRNARRQAFPVEGRFSDALCADEGRQITFDPADSFTEHKEFFFETGRKALP
jgi:hypothetical protein